MYTYLINKVIGDYPEDYKTERYNEFLDLGDAIYWVKKEINLYFSRTKDLSEIGVFIVQQSKWEHLVGILNDEYKFVPMYKIIKES